MDRQGAPLPPRPLRPNGVRVYDFLRGVEDYKFEWADTGERCLDFTAYRPGLSVAITLALDGMRSAAKAVLR